MVDERRVRRMLQRIAEDVRYLEARAQSDRVEILDDEDKLAALKYYLLTSIEGCLNVAQHLCASEGWGPPRDNADAIRRLGDQDVLDPALAGSLAQAARFRNVLVHEYVRVDDERVVAYLDRVGEIGRFVASVAAWAERQAS